MLNMPIPTFAINVKERTDRYAHIKMQFDGKPEFNLNVIEAEKHTDGAFGLWITISKLLRSITNKRLPDFIILCEDDHLFTEHYSSTLLAKGILQAKEKRADILLGGVSWFQTAIPISENLQWIQRFSGLQFVIIFKHFYKFILESKFNAGDTADYKISDISNNKFVIYPFLSIQKDFGYSDVTPKNNIPGRIDSLFKKSAESLRIIKNVTTFYKLYQANEILDDLKYDKITIPTYIINLSRDNTKLRDVKNQFKHRHEFHVTIFDACANTHESIKFWTTLIKIISIAKQNKEDAIIVSCEDHIFTKYYSKEYLLRNIVQSHNQGSDLLIGGCEDFNHVIPIARNRYWVNQFSSSQFLVIFKKLYQRILDEPFDKTMNTDSLLSEITGSKALLYPFISSSINTQNNIREKTERRLEEVDSFCKRDIVFQYD